MFDLRRIGAVAAILTLAWFGFGRMAQAQTNVTVTNTGVLATVVDDRNGLTMTVTMTTPSGTISYVVSRANTSVWAGFEKISPTALDNYVGTPAVIISTPMGSQQVAGRINLLVFPVQGTVGPDNTPPDNNHGQGGTSTTTGGTTGAPAATTGGTSTTGGNNTTGGNDTTGGTTSTTKGGHGETGNSGKLDNNQHGSGFSGGDHETH